MYNNPTDIGDRVRLFFHLHAFLKVWDPQCLDIVDLKSKPQVVRRLSLGSNLSKSTRRRPSAIASLVIETHTVRDEHDCAAMSRQSWLAHNAPYFPDSLFGDTKSTARLRDLFGYGLS